MTPAALLVIAFLRMDVETGRLMEQQWDSERPVIVGSLTKPFVALAYAQSHQFQYPQVECKRCWLPRGHGRIGIVEAIAQSCNTYFDALRRELHEGELEAVARRLGLSSPEVALPQDLLRAYVELAKRRSEPGVGPVLDGMRMAASTGTAKELQRDALAKTGTGPCTHARKAPGDGFAVVLYPAAQPRIALLVRVHGRPGAFAAKEARRLLQ